MNYYVLSDETGDGGLNHPTIESRSSVSFASLSLVFLNQSQLSAFVESGFISAKKNFGRVKKWSNLSSSIKNNPSLLKNFINDLASIFKTKSGGMLPLGALCVINKYEFFYPQLSLKKNKAMLESGLSTVYRLPGYRIFPFLKKYHYARGAYPREGMPSLKWYIDQNSGKIAKDFKQEVLSVAERLGIHIGSFEFLPKKELNSEDQEKSIACRGIIITDIILGIAGKCFELHAGCNFTGCKEKLGQECQNRFRETWDELRRNMFGEITINFRTAKIWEWSSLFYIPEQTRDNHSNFIGKDKYFEMRKLF